MDYPEQGTRVIRHDGDRESWTMAMRAPIPALRGLVRGYCLYEERRTSLPTHQHLPQPDGVFIIGLDGNMDVRDSKGEICRVEAGEGFLGGLQTAPAQTRSERHQRGMEIDLTPLGTYLVLGGLPMDAIANRVHSVEDLLGRDGREFGERLAESTEDSAMFEIVDSFLAQRILEPRHALAAGLEFAWDALSNSHGRVRISEITGQLGWSRRRLVEEFRNAVGLAPKTTARIMRFDHALELWKADPTQPWTEVALTSGYHDQAHFSREVRALSGQTPSELAGHLLPESGGMAA
jgi:AraC-like DNA-binding protein